MQVHANALRGQLKLILHINLCRVCVSISGLIWTLLPSLRRQLQIRAYTAGSAYCVWQTRQTGGAGARHVDCPPGTARPDRGCI